MQIRQWKTGKWWFNEANSSIRLYSSSTKKTVSLFSSVQFSV